mgnify:CR=1 FL=1
MKILMGAVIVLSMAAVTACGKKPEVADEKTMESVDEEIAEIPESAGQGFERVANQSDWNGTYYREDGEYITVYDTDEDYLFLSCPESSYELEMISQALDYITAHLDEPIRQEDLSRQLGVSVSALYKLSFL